MKNFDSFLNYFYNNEYLSIFNTCIGILSLLITIIIIIFRKRGPKPVYAKRSFNVISESFKNISNLEVLYNGIKIDRLTITKIAFVNNGDKPLDFSDLATGSHLQILPVDNVRILEANVIYQSNPRKNNLKTVVNNNEVKVSFDYFYGNQAGIIKIAHSGKDSSSLKFEGTFKNTGEIRNIGTSKIEKGFASGLHFSPLNLLYKIIKFENVMLKIMSLLCFLVSLINFTNPIFNSGSIFSHIYYIIIGLIFLFFGIFFLKFKISISKDQFLYLIDE